MELFLDTYHTELCVGALYTFSPSRLVNVPCGDRKDLKGNAETMFLPTTQPFQVFFFL